MYSRKFQFIFVILFAGLFALPFLQGLYPLIKEKPLGGSTFQAQVGSFSIQTLKSGEYFRSIESWYGENFGFHKSLVRLENQLNYSVFGDFPRMYRGITIVGKDRWLFQKWLVISGFQNRWLDNKQMASTLTNLRNLQDYLDQKGIPMILVIAPMKGSIHPEMIPREFLKYDLPENKNYYERMLPFLDSYGIRYYDSIAEGRKLRETNPAFQLFAPDASHWSYSFAANCTKDIVNRINPLMKHPLPEFEVDYSRQDTAYWAEVDLRTAANLSYSYTRDELIAYPLIIRTKKDQPLPKIAVVGDSYAGAIVDTFVATLGGDSLVESLDLYYYFNGFEQFPGSGRTPLDRSKFDLDRDIVSKNDALIIVVAEAALFEIGFGFLETVFKNGPLPLSEGDH